MEELNPNPIQQLHDILKEAVDQGDPDSPVINALQKPLKFDLSNAVERTEQLFEFMKLLYDVEKTVRNLKTVKNLDYYLKPIQDIQKLFVDKGFFVKWQEFRVPLSSQNLVSSLGTFADTVSREKEELFLRDYELSKILEKFEALSEEVDSSDLDQEVKQFLKSKLREVCEAIRNYSVNSPDELRKSIKVAIGEITIGSINISTSEKEKQVFKNTVEWIVKFGALVTLSRQTQEWLLPEVVHQIQNIRQLFLPPG